MKAKPKITMTMDLSTAAKMVNELALLAARRGRDAEAETSPGMRKLLDQEAAETLKLSQAVLTAFDAGPLSLQVEEVAE